MGNRLGPLQRALLEEFFRHTKDFFLTGGGALVGYHLGHRTTEDLDLFTVSGSLEDGERSLAEAARTLNAEVESIQTSPEFRRRLVRQGSESVIVDLVRDRSAQGEEEKQQHGRIRVDPPSEILANKLCTVLSRAEIRDLVDLMALERAGYRIENALPLANRKDGGMEPGQLAWVLSQIQIGVDATIPGGFGVEEVREFIAELRVRLARAAFPDHPDK